MLQIHSLLPRCNSNIQGIFLPPGVSYAGSKSSSMIRIKARIANPA